MANVTILEFFELPDANGDLSFPADIKTTIATSSTHTVRDETRYIIVTADADCRISFDGTAAVASGMNVLTAAPNPFKLNPAPSGTRTLKFL